MAKRRWKESERRIAKLVKEGRGQGTGHGYRPWITVQDFSSRGRVHRQRGGKSGRVVELMSDVESDVFMQFDVSPAVLDIREQFPLPRSETLLVAEALGYRHPAADGVMVVMTTDLVVDMVGGSRVAVSVKCEDELVLPRTLEKLEIERVYWTDRGVPWSLVVDKDQDRGERLNHQEVAEWATLGLVDGADCFEARAADLLVDVAAMRPDERLIDALRRSEARRGWERGDAIAALKRLLALRLVVRTARERLDVFGPASQVEPAGA